MAPPIREPQVLAIAELFLSNRTPPDFETLPEHHPVREVHHEGTKVRNTQSLPKLFLYGHVIRIHNPRFLNVFRSSRCACSNCVSHLQLLRTCSRQYTD